MSISSNDEARQTVDAVMKRDRRRIRLLAGITIALWVAAFFLLPSVYLPICAKIKHEIVDLAHPPGSPSTLTAQELADKIGPVFGASLFAGFIMMSGMLLIEVLAAISTVALVLTIRRVTLRQVNTSLAEISEQLKRLGR